jgi:hypothetical protein
VTRTNERGEPYLEGEALRQWRLPFDGQCWVCGSTDLSSEHKFKRSDLRSMGAGDLFWTDGQSFQQLRSTNDKRARFRVNNLCKRCNNERSQPADRAWQQFSTFVAGNWARLGSVAALDMAQVYGAVDADNGSLLLRQYVVRHLGCRISEAGFAVPDDLRNYLSGAEPPTVAICLFYSHERAGLMGPLPDDGTLSHLSIGPMLGELSKSLGRGRVFYTEICVGPVGALVKWSDNEPVGTSFGNWANLYSRVDLPYPDLHEPWPSYSGREGV